MKDFDFNLMRVLDAVLASGSVTAAADKLHLSVPATSHALARLREAMGDPLLVRAGRRLVATPRALQLREPVARWLTEARAFQQPLSRASLDTLPRSFVVRAPDGIQIAFGAALAQSLQRDMPRAHLRFVAETNDDASALRDGRVDLDLGNFQPREPEMEIIEFLRQKQMALVRRGHDLVGKTLTARRYVAHAHVAVQLRTQAASPVDRALAGLGLERRIVMTVAQANIAPIVAARSDLVATISERMALAMASALGLEVLPLGFATEPEPMVMAWHPRHSSDPAHAWLRETMLRVIKGEAHAPPRRPSQATPRRSVSHP